MPHDVLVDLANEMNESGSDWEHRARVLRGFLRVTRAGMEALIEEANPDTDWAEEYQEVAESINEMLKELI